MNNKPLAGWAQSSVDPATLSKTIESAIKIIGGLLVFVGVISNDEVNALLGQVGTLVPAVYVIWNFAELIFGVLRKLVVKFATK